MTLELGDDLDLAATAPRPADIVFIDSSHEYAHTCAEIVAYEPLVRPGGVMVFHDTGFDDVARAVADWPAARKPDRVDHTAASNGLAVAWLP